MTSERIWQATSAFRKAALRDDGTSPLEWDELEPLLALGTAAVLPLIELLQDECEVVRGQAADALTNWRCDGRIVGPLSGALADESTFVRAASAHALGDTLSATTVGNLAALLQDAEPQVRLQAAQALGKIGSEAGYRAAAAALWDQDDQVRFWAGHSLRDSGAFAVLREAIDRGAQVDAQYIAETLGETGGGGALEYLVLLLRDRGAPEERDELIHLAKTELEWADGDIEALGNTLLENNYRVQGEAALALGRLGDPRAADYLIRALEHPHHIVQLGAAQALQRLGDVRGTQAILDMLSNPRERMLEDYVAAVTLGKLNEPQVDAALSEMRCSADPARAEFAERSLGKFGKPPDLRGLDLLRSQVVSNWHSHYQPLGAVLRKMPQAQAVNALADIAMRADDARLRRAAAWALTQFSHAEVDEALLALLHNEDVDAVSGAYAYYVQRALEEGVPTLLESLECLGHKGMAEDLANSGHPTLAGAGAQWLANHPNAEYLDYEPWGMPTGPEWKQNVGG